MRTKPLPTQMSRLQKALNSHERYHLPLMLLFISIIKCVQRTLVQLSSVGWLVSVRNKFKYGKSKIANL